MRCAAARWERSRRQPLHQLLHTELDRSAHLGDQDPHRSTPSGTPTFMPATGLPIWSQIIGNGNLGRGGVQRIASGDDLQHHRRVLHRLAERARMIQRRSERDQSVARDAAVGRHQPDYAAERRRLADRAAGVGAQRRHGRSRGNCRCRASRRASRHARAIARDCAPDGSRSFRSTSPWRTHRNWSCQG